MIPAAGEGELGVLLQVDFAFDLSPAVFAAEMDALTEAYAAVPGLRWKIWAVDDATGQFSAYLYFDDQASLQAFAESDLAASVMGSPGFSDFVVTSYSIIGEESGVTRGPVR